MRLASIGLVAAWAVVAPGACGHDSTEPDAGAAVCATETRADLYEPGAEKIGPNGLGVRLMESRPAPPARGDNEWTVQVLDADGKPVDGATIEVTPYMPDHRHGTSILAAIAPLGHDGLYRLSPVNLFMASLWQVTVTVRTPAGATDSVVFAFCIEG